MLVELRDVEVHVEPREILEQAIQDGDLQVHHIMEVLDDEFELSQILECMELDDIMEYVDKNTKPVNVFEAVKSFTDEQKALLVWQLLKG